MDVLAGGTAEVTAPQSQSAPHNQHRRRTAAANTLAAHRIQRAYNPSHIMVDKITTVARSKIGQRIGKVSTTEMLQLERSSSSGWPDDPGCSRDDRHVVDGRPERTCSLRLAHQERCIPPIAITVRPEGIESPIRYSKGSCSTN